MGSLGPVALIAALEDNATSLRDFLDMPVATDGKGDFPTLAFRIEGASFRHTAEYPFWRFCFLPGQNRRQRDCALRQEFNSHSFNLRVGVD